jgi:hypothetical protein
MTFIAIQVTDGAECTILPDDPNAAAHFGRAKSKAEKNTSDQGLFSKLTIRLITGANTSDDTAVGDTEPTEESSDEDDILTLPKKSTTATASRSNPSSSSRGGGRGSGTGGGYSPSELIASLAASGEHSTIMYHSVVSLLMAIKDASEEASCPVVIAAPVGKPARNLAATFAKEARAAKGHGIKIGDTKRGRQIRRLLTESRIALGASLEVVEGALKLIATTPRAISLIQKNN